MKYAITHCYTDKNKGDAAIIVSTAQLIHSIDSNAEVNMFSTYRAGDQRLGQEHEIIKKHAKEIHPALFGEPEPFLGEGRTWARIISFVVDFLKYSMLLISRKRRYISFFLKKEEVHAVDNFMASDFIISKGGSFLSTENTSIRQTLSLIRLLYPFLLARRYKKRIFIFSQSLGPVEGRLNQLIFLAMLAKVEKIYLRESLCLDKYKTVRSVCDAVPFKIIPDTAFYLVSDSSEADPVNIDTSKFNAGFTVVDHDFKYIGDSEKREHKYLEYKESIIESIKYLIDEHNAVVRLFPQVIVDNSHLGHNDIKISREIVGILKGTKYESNVFFHDGDWSPSQLRHMYSKMDIFIGTRLHSVIFSLSCGVPSVNISYHGTKSQGVLGDIKGMESCVVDISSIDKYTLIDKISYVIGSRDLLRENLSQQMIQIRGRLLNAMKEIIC